MKLLPPLGGTHSILPPLDNLYDKLFLLSVLSVIIIISDLHLRSTKPKASMFPRRDQSYAKLFEGKK